MKGASWSASPGAVLAGALLLALLRGEELTALLIAVLVHELGHGATILLLGQRVTGIRAELGGLRLDYCGGAGPGGRALIALAGPLAGLFYALLAARLGRSWGWDWLCLSAGLSLLLSLINLLPSRPLDGGQLCAALAEAALGSQRGERACRVLGLGTGCVLLALGIALILRGKGAAAALIGANLLFHSFPEGEGLVKNGKVR